MQKNKNNKIKSLQDKVFSTLFLLPSLSLLTMFIFFPVIKTFYRSLFLTNLKGKEIEFVKLGNFNELFSNPLFWNSLSVSFKFSFIMVLGTISISLCLALLVSEKLKGTKIFNMIFSSSMGVSTSVGSIIWILLFQPNMKGINTVLNAFGVASIDWLNEPKYALLAIATVSIWMNIGFSFLVFLSGIKNINKDIYESAEIDGVGYFSKIFYVTLPLLSPTIFYLIIINTIKSFQIFGEIDILTQGGPLHSTNVMVYDIWKYAFVERRYDLASALSVILFLILMLIIAIQFSFERKVHYQ